MIQFFKSSDSKYKEAKKRMWDIYKAINSNIPDYDAFKLPFNDEPVGYPSSAVLAGEVSQVGLYKNNDLRIFDLQYTLDGQIKKHTHYGYWEFIYIKNGTFMDLKDRVFKPGDTILIDGFDIHSLKCETLVGELVLMFTKDKRQAKFDNIRKFI